MGGDYRDKDGALAGRRARLKERVAEITAAADDRLERLTDKQQDDHASWLKRMVPSDDSVEALAEAEEAAERHTAWFEEALVLAAEIEGTEKPLVPEGKVIRRWVIYFLVGLVMIPIAIMALLDSIMNPGGY